MAKGTVWKVEITESATGNYQQEILPYLINNFEESRVFEIDESITLKIKTLENYPTRGAKEKHIKNQSKNYLFILFKETKNFELKIIYYIDKSTSTVYVTDFFPTKMNPIKLGRRNK